ncbi:MAG: 16S rRNA (guanine(527)-N(7))-methyltransferase RsmG [Symploca sp. SIO1C4]|uniref:Ribosomal RNA small subunit methyltransferase G n=1 Tax=Symploca sp. SIO1C4 TaxID=2607765 RepID=A0A6B3N5C9_9CYAN|nr:16S rRNA (guanine(527)-N(7))-methyltransferase RsmG [Symploca sp. SIO1C4]NET04481.1 16S rRNA (guanine(527)-N(7))-methyltransferase RsmG [Symploca sp. SIO2B6]
MENTQSSPLLPEMNPVWQQTLGWQPTKEQNDLFERLYEGILSGNRQFNLTRISVLEEFWEKHLWDSLRGVAPLLTSMSSSPRVIDIGTGAGFPGLPVAIAIPQSHLTLLDSTRKKINFLQTLIRELGINNAEAIVGRAEAIGQQPQHRYTYDIALVRAVASASVCAEYALPLLKTGGLAVVYRGYWSEEEKDALTGVVEQLGGVIESIEKFTTPLSNSIRHCLYLRLISPTPAKFPRPVGVPAKQPL